MYQDRRHGRERDRDYERNAGGYGGGGYGGRGGGGGGGGGYGGRGGRGGGPFYHGNNPSGFRPRPRPFDNNGQRPPRSIGGYEYDQIASYAGGAFREEIEKDRQARRARHEALGENLKEEYMDLTQEDCAFICGKSGSTKRKIARVSGAELNLIETETKLRLSGSEAEINNAKVYVSYVLAQRHGDVDVSKDSGRSDLTIVYLPSDTVGYIMGKGGYNLRGIEDEFGTLMFFAKVKRFEMTNGNKNNDNNNNGGKRDNDDMDEDNNGRSGTDNGASSDQGTMNGSVMEQLAIFGSRRARRGAELKVMSGVEFKKPGTFLNTADCSLKYPLLQPGDNLGDDWGYETTVLDDEEISYALGSGGMTKTKLADASGCILEYFNRTAIFCGSHADRTRAKDYLSWLLKQRVGTVQVDISNRDDVTVVDVPTSCIGFITGSRGSTLRETERKSRTFCFCNGFAIGREDPKNDNSNDKSNTNDSGGDRDMAAGGGQPIQRGSEQLLIFSHLKVARLAAKEIVEDMINIHQRRETGEYVPSKYDKPRNSNFNGGRGGRGYGGGGGGRGYGDGGGRGGWHGGRGFGGGGGGGSGYGGPGDQGHYGGSQGHGGYNGGGGGNQGNGNGGGGNSPHGPGPSNMGQPWGQPNSYGTHLQVNMGGPGYGAPGSGYSNAAGGGNGGNGGGSGGYGAPGSGYGGQRSRFY